jgi:hypothetical protein
LGGTVRKYPDWLTAANNSNESMTANPGSGKTRKAEMRYRIYINLVLISANAFLLPWMTYPKAAVHESRLDEEGENLFNSRRNTALSQVRLYGDTVLPTHVVRNNK